MRLKSPFPSIGAMLLSAVALYSFVSLSAQVVVEPGPPRIAPSPRTVAMAPSQQITLPVAPVVSLGGIDESVRDLPSPKRGVARVGIERTVTAQILAQGTWQSTGNGSNVWRLALRSTNAIGLRAHLTNFNVQDGQVWVHDTTGRQSFGPYTGRGHFMDESVWSGTVYSDTIEIEYKPAGAQRPGTVPFTVRLMHLYRAGGLVAPRLPAPDRGEAVFLPGSPAMASRPAAASPVTTQASSVPSCLLDAACYTNNPSYPAVALVVGAQAYLQFSDSSGNGFQCSGTMLNAPNGAPILLTAGHCINDSATLESLNAAFGYQDATCGGGAPDPSTLPQTSGEQILSFQDSPFIDDSTLAGMTGDIDYSLVLMSGFPDSTNFTLAGYSTAEIGFGTNVTSLSYPGGYSLRFAYAPRTDSTLTSVDPTQSSYFSNAYEIDYNTNGRTDDGSSGSGIFDNGGHLLGSLSTGVIDCNNPDASGNCPANDNACDVTGAYATWYEKFGPVYQIVNSYLEEPVLAPASTNPSVFSASPNPVRSSNGGGSVTLTYNAPSGVTSTQIHIGSPTGTLLAEGGKSGTATATGWVTNQMQFFLQDTSNGNALTAANTLAVVTVTVITEQTTGTPSTNPSVFLASPNPISSPTGLGTTTLTYNAPSSVTSTQIHVGSPTGPVLVEGGNSGTAVATGWVSNGLQFYLQDTSNGNPLTAANTLAVVTMTVNAANANTLVANPSTIVTPNGSGYGQTTLTWSAPGVGIVDIYVGSPSGALFARVGTSGSATTGDWVTDGMTFYLVDASNGSVLTSTTVHVNLSGGSTTNPGSVSLYLNPNPITVSAGQSLASTTVYWNSGGVESTQIRVNSANGPLLAQGGAVGSTTATGWVTNGMQFFLVDRSGNTIASTTAQLTTNPVNLGGTRFTMTPPVAGTATINWNTDVSSNVEIHENSPSGPLVGSSEPVGGNGTNGSAQVRGVTNGTVFYLQDVSYSANSIFSASPNPIASETGLGSTTLSFDVSNSITPASPVAITSTEIRIGSPTGALLMQGGATGTASATGWVSNGMQFFLQDISNGNPLTEANTLAIVSVGVTSTPESQIVNLYNVNPLTLQYTLATVIAQ